jgi:hypothetical protein
LQTPALQVPPLQECPHAPQLTGSLVRLISHPSLGRLLQFAKPVAQTKAHDPPWQVEVAFAAAGQTVQVAPHAVGSESITHFAAHAWKPVLQVVLQAPRAQVTSAWSTAGHGWLHPPQ